MLWKIGIEIKEKDGGGHATTFNLVGKPGCFARRVSLPPALPSTLTASGWIWKGGLDSGFSLVET
jgi:hypothetical protein